MWLRVPATRVFVVAPSSLDVSGDASFEEKVGGAKSGARNRSSFVRLVRLASVNAGIRRNWKKVRPQSPRWIRHRLASIWEEKINLPPTFFSFPHTTRLTP